MVSELDWLGTRGGDISPPGGLSQLVSYRSGQSEGPPSSWSHNSEVATLSEWTSEVDTAGLLNRTTTTAAVHEGTYGYEINGNGTALTAYLVKSEGIGGVSDYEYRFWFKIAAGWTMTESFRQAGLLEFYDSGGKWLAITLPGSRAYVVDRWAPSFVRDAAQVGSTATNTWVEIVITVRGAGTASGSYTVTSAGASIVSKTGLNFTGRADTTQIRLGQISGGTGVSSGFWYLDDGQWSALPPA